jgi:menaquinone-dependent protoporphyrinogen IX oxidase
MPGTLVVFYSRSGHTKKVAESIASTLQCDIDELVDQKKRGGVIGYIKSGRDAMRKQETEIREVRKNPGDYDLVIIGTPIWGGRMTPAIRTYLTRYRDSLKGVAFFCTSGNGKSQKGFPEMEELSGKAPVATFEVSTADVNRDLYEDAVASFAAGFARPTRGTGTETVKE